jgi:hypothetical protein
MRGNKRSKAEYMAFFIIIRGNKRPKSGYKQQKLSTEKSKPL